MGKDRRRKDRDEENDMSRLKILAKLMRGVKPPQRNHYHEKKPKQRDKSLKDVANDYNRSGDIEEAE